VLCTVDVDVGAGPAAHVVRDRRREALVEDASQVVVRPDPEVHAVPRSLELDAELSEIITGIRGRRRGRARVGRAAGRTTGCAGVGRVGRTGIRRVVRGRRGVGRDGRLEVEPRAIRTVRLAVDVVVDLVPFLHQDAERAGFTVVVDEVLHAVGEVGADLGPLARVARGRREVGAGEAEVEAWIHPEPLPGLTAFVAHDGRGAVTVPGPVLVTAKAVTLQVGAHPLPVEEVRTEREPNHAVVQRGGSIGSAVRVGLAEVAHAGRRIGIGAGAAGGQVQGREGHNDRTHRSSNLSQIAREMILKCEQTPAFADTSLTRNCVGDISLWRNTILDWLIGRRSIGMDFRFGPLPSIQQAVFRNPYRYVPSRIWSISK
jgi:hypothetical protein